MVTDYLKPSKIIEGEYFQRGNRLIFQSAITDEQMDRTLISFEPVECDSDSPLDCIEALNQRILGYLKIEEKPLESLEEHPPKYEAYELFSKAKALRAESDSLYLAKLNEAIEADPSYFEPKTYRFIYYYNQGSYHTADSLLQEIKKESGMYYRQRMLLNLYQALLDGNFRNAGGFALAAAVMSAIGVIHGASLHWPTLTGVSAGYLIAAGFLLIYPIFHKADEGALSNPPPQPAE